MEKMIRKNCDEVKTEILDAIEKMPEEECKALLKEVSVAILGKSHYVEPHDAKALGDSQQLSEEKVFRFLTRLGMPTHVKGHSYAQAAIIYLFEHKKKYGVDCLLIKELYPHIAEKFTTTASRVERAIRHAIELTWDRGNVDVLNKIFGYTVSINRGKPTNKEFLSLIVNYLSANDN